MTCFSRCCEILGKAELYVSQNVTFLKIQKIRIIMWSLLVISSIFSIEEWQIFRQLFLRHEYDDGLYLCIYLGTSPCSHMFQDILDSVVIWSAKICVSRNPWKIHFREDAVCVSRIAISNLHFWSCAPICTLRKLVSWFLHYPVHYSIFLSPWLSNYKRYWKLILLFLSNTSGVINQMFYYQFLFIITVIRV